MTLMFAPETLAVAATAPAPCKVERRDFTIANERGADIAAREALLGARASLVRR